MSDTDHLTNPVIVVAFSGWNDAGEAASRAARTLLKVGNATKLATLDPEVFTDFAVNRPVLRLNDDQQRHIEWPEVTVWGANLPGADVVVITGPEPSLRWRTFSNELVQLAEHLGAPTIFTMGGLLADVPHTRPPEIVGTSPDEALRDRFGLRTSSYEGPTGIVGVLNMALTQAGLPTVSLWATLPGYAAQVPSPPAATALLARLVDLMRTHTPPQNSASEFSDYTAQVDALIDGDPEMLDYINRLETLADEAEPPTEWATPTIDPTDPEGLAAEVERFLRDQDR